jgi:zinc protease
MMFNGPTKYTVKNANYFYAAVDIIKQRIIHILREQLSLTYNGSISGVMERVPYDSYSISADLPCSPENTARVIEALKQEIESLKKDGPQQEELDRVKQIWLKERQIDKQTNQFWSSRLQDAVLYDTDPAIMLTYEDRINAITTEQVRDAARRYFSLDNVVEAVLFPAAKRTTKPTAKSADKKAVASTAAVP